MKERRWSYVEPDDNDRPIVITKTDKEILDFYWKYWSDGMKRIGKTEKIMRENCIQDWAVVNWATEI